MNKSSHRRTSLATLVGWVHRDDLLRTAAVIWASSGDMVIDPCEYETNWAETGRGSFQSTITIFVCRG
jgi:hypothetical protein